MLCPCVCCVQLLRFRGGCKVAADYFRKLYHHRLYAFFADFQRFLALGHTLALMQAVQKGGILYTTLFHGVMIPLEIADAAPNTMECEVFYKVG